MALFALIMALWNFTEFVYQTVLKLKLTPQRSTSSNHGIMKFHRIC